MKEIHIADQPNPGLPRTIRITLDAVRYRLFRSLITVAVVAVAVAFLMNILSETLIKRAIHESTRQKVAQMHLVHDWASRLSMPPTRERLIRELGAGHEATKAEAVRIGGLTPAAVMELGATCRQAVRYLDFFESLPYSDWRSLCGNSRGIAVFDRLSNPAQFADFETALRQARSVRLPGTPADLRAFLDRWQAADPALSQVEGGYARAVAAVTQARGEAPILEAIRGINGAFGEEVTRAGFDLTPAARTTISQQAGKVLDRNRIEKSLEIAAVRQTMAIIEDVMPSEVTLIMMWSVLGEPARAAEYLAVLEKGGGSWPGLTAKRIQEIQHERMQEVALDNAGRLTADLGTGWLGMGQRMSLLLLVSMLVCTIGISNAMLMSVTERFREIATLKCLGALDGTIMSIFVLESCALGAVGGLIGAVLGGAIALGRMLAAFGVGFAGTLPVGELALAVVAASLAGILLAAVAAIYPALKAARLAPMEAMRIQ